MNCWTTQLTWNTSPALTGHFLLREATLANRKVNDAFSGSPGEYFIFSWNKITATITHCWTGVLFITAWKIASDNCKFPPSIVNISYAPIYYAKPTPLRLFNFILFSLDSNYTCCIQVESEYCWDIYFWIHKAGGKIMVMNAKKTLVSNHKCLYHVPTCILYTLFVFYRWYSVVISLRAIKKLPQLKAKQRSTLRDLNYEPCISQNGSSLKVLVSWHNYLLPLASIKI